MLFQILKPTIFSVFLILCLVSFHTSKYVYAKTNDDINFEAIKKYRIIYKNLALYSNDKNEIKTKTIANLSVLLSECRAKGLAADIKETDLIEFLVETYKNGGVFRQSESSDENAGGITSAEAFLALAKHRNELPENLQKRVDEILADTIQTKIAPLKENFQKSTFNEINGVRTPLWLVDGRGDVSSIYILGLCELEPSDSRNFYIRMLAEGVKEFTDLKRDEFPYCAHYESSDRPHLFALSSNYQIKALAEASKILKEKSYVLSAKLEADNLYAYLLSSYGPICGMAPAPIIYPQTPQGANIFTQNLAALAEAVQDEIYSKLSGLACSWFYTGNLSGENIYDEKTGETKTILTKDGASKDTSLEASIAALSALVAIYKTPAWDYRLYSADPTIHAFIILQAEEGQAVRKNYDIEEIDYPGKNKGKLVAIKRENSFWLKFQIDEEDYYAFHLCYLKQKGFGASTSILMRIDGDKIYSVPLGGSSDSAYMFMQEVLERRPLLPGLHSMGIKFSGLLLGKAASIDCVILQPLTQRKIFVSPSGKKAAIIKSFYNKEIIYEASELSQRNFIPREAYTVSSSGKTVKSQLPPDGKIRIPAYGYILFEGK